jgi:hypothetical protein
MLLVCAGVPRHETLHMDGDLKRKRQLQKQRQQEAQRVDAELAECSFRPQTTGAKRGSAAGARRASSFGHFLMHGSAWLASREARVTRAQKQQVRASCQAHGLWRALPDVPDICIPYHMHTVPYAYHTVPDICIPAGR